MITDVDPTADVGSTVKARETSSRRKENAELFP